MLTLNPAYITSWIASAFIEKAKQLKENATEVPEVPFRLTELHHVVFRSQTRLSSCDLLRLFSTTSQSCNICLLPLSGGNCNDLFHLNRVWSSAAVIIPFFFSFFLDFNCWTQNCLSDKGELHQSRLYSRISAEWDERQSPPCWFYILFLTARGEQRAHQSPHHRSPVFPVTLPVLLRFPVSGMGC